MVPAVATGTRLRTESGRWIGRVEGSASRLRLARPLLCGRAPLSVWPRVGVRLVSIYGLFAGRIDALSMCASVIVQDAEPTVWCQAECGAAYGGLAGGPETANGYAERCQEPNKQIERREIRYGDGSRLYGGRRSSARPTLIGDNAVQTVSAQSECYPARERICRQC